MHKNTSSGSPLYVTALLVIYRFSECLRIENTSFGLTMSLPEEEEESEHAEEDDDEWCWGLGRKTGEGEGESVLRGEELSL